MTVKYEIELFLRNMHAVNAVLTERSIRYHFIIIVVAICIMLKGSWLLSALALAQVILSIPKGPDERPLGCDVDVYTDKTIDAGMIYHYINTRIPEAYANNTILFKQWQKTLVFLITMFLTLIVGSSLLH
jgi:hypothetical protein